MSGGGDGGDRRPTSCLALSGGVGGAKLALGLARHLAPGELAIAANVGDDFEHLGLTICPDIDTLVYTLSGLANPETGWGRAGDTATFMHALAGLGGETWFHLGDGDLAMHVARSHRLRSGESLSRITADICERLGIEARILPASDDALRTIVETEDGPLALQHYFVREKCAPKVKGFRYDGSRTAQVKKEILGALSEPSLQAVIICPSNPYISIDPMLAMPALRQALKDCAAPVVAVSPIVGGAALKGPTAKMMHELGAAVSADSVARHYRDLIDGFVLDPADAALEKAVRGLGMEVLITPSVMTSLGDKIRLARETFAFAVALSRSN
ncbi:MAG: 2-phospho-L-lactate transferase [Rhodospirillales bacterium]|nr:2-phospho-L-lactate transferase [Rhodospirillales bacterium]MDP6842304.1 2-phospho-L-lactate transferase [Rhodospirillales bacterium]